VVVLDLNNYSGYLLWAGDRMRSLVEHLTDEEFDKELGYFSHNSIRDMCFHIVLAQDYSLTVIKGTYPGEFTDYVKELKHMNKKELLKAWRQSDENLAKELCTDLETEVVFSFDEKKYKVAKYDYLLQYPSHTIFHRGQLIIALKILGKEVIGTDYLYYLMEITNPES
jgi:uncharacterized damage-inducible protein DinB